MTIDDDDHQSVAEYALEVENLEAQIAGLNSLKSDVYKRAKVDDVNVTALRTAIAIRRKQEKDPETFAKLDRKVHEYLRLIDEDASRVHAHEGEAEVEEPAPKAKITKRTKGQAGDQPGAAAS